MPRGTKSIMSEDRTLRDPLSRLADYGGLPAIVAMGGDAKSLSFAELADVTTRMAGGLIAAGVGRGEGVAIHAPNRPEWIVAALAVILAGGIVVPLDARLDRETLADEVKRSGCRRIFTTTDRQETVRQVLDGDGSPEIYLLDTTTAGSPGQSWSSLLDKPVQELPALGENDDAALFFTSGTTGTPKGVPLTHRNLLSNLRGLLEADLIGERERALLPLPLHHVYPFVVGMLAPLAGGATVVLPAGVSGPEIRQALHEAGVTAVIGIPRLLDALLAAIRRRIARNGRLAASTFDGLLDLSIGLHRRFGWRVGHPLFRPLRRAVAPELRLLASGGAPLAPDVARALEGLGWDVLSGYGLTETSPIVSFNTRAHNRIGTVGRPLPDVDVAIGLPDEAGHGEILVRGPNLFRGYKDDREATAAAFTSDGWFRTRDLGTLVDGYLMVGARVNETIVLPGGRKIFPEEVETAYQKSPLFDDVAVLERAGKLAALVVPDAAALRERGTHDAAKAVGEELRQRAGHVSPHQRVSEYAVTRAPLPRTTLRKLRRHLLPELYQQARSCGASAGRAEALSEADRSLLQADVVRRAWDWLHRRHADKTITMDAALQSDLGIDSLDWLSLTLEIEDEAGVRLGEDAVGRADTVRGLLEEILAAAQEGGAFPEAGVLAPEQRQWLEPAGSLIDALRVPLYALNWLVLRVLFRLRVQGRAHLPGHGPYILAPNHASFLDPFALGAALRREQLQETYWAGITDYLFRTAPRRLFSRVAHVLPIDPARAPSASLALGAEVVKRDKILVWFPEGQRSPTGELQAFMPGIGRLLATSRVPVVPVHITGSFEAWPRHRRLPRLRPLSVRFGAAMDPSRTQPDREADGAPEWLADALHDRLEQLMAGGAADALSVAKRFGAE